VQAKSRLKTLLKDEVIYTDGMRPDEVSKLVRQTQGTVGFFEDDLTKQDR